MLRKVFAGILAVLISTSPAWAQTKAATKNRARKSTQPTYPAYVPSTPPAEPVAPPEAPSTKHFYLTALYSSANTIKYKGSVDLFGVPTGFTAAESTTGALGFAGGYISREAGRFGYSGELAYELPRTSSGVEGMLDNQQAIHGKYDENPSNSVLTLAANGNYSLNSTIYIFGGINYPFTKGNGDTLNGLPGYQIGGGFAFSPNISSELSYRTLRLKGTIDSPGLNLRVDEATFSGMILAVHYLF